MKKHFAPVLTGLLLLAGCAERKQASTQASASAAAYHSVVSMANGGKVWSALWQQRSAEYEALCFQAYNTAKLRTDQAVLHKGSQPQAIITDIDETVLDNSPYDAQRALNNQEYSAATWKAWTAKGQCDTVPGAPGFLKYAASKGITIFYITNRDADESAATLSNLQRYQLPFADEAHLIPRGSGGSSKESRRQQVMKNYEVVLLCGDNLPDFDALYDNHPAEPNRKATTQQLRALFGSKYIIIPNPSYGDWESGLFSFNNKLTPAQKDSVMKSKVDTTGRPQR